MPFAFSGGGFSGLIGGLVNGQENCHRVTHSSLFFVTSVGSSEWVPVQGAAGHAVPNIANASAPRRVCTPENEGSTVYRAFSLHSIWPKFSFPLF